MLEARNAGKAIADARGEMGMVVDTFRYYAGAPERLLGDTIPVAGGQAFTVREPVGVVGLITPWNFPLTIASWKLAPALAAGNTVVLKPAELTPLTALRFAELALEAGLPEGVVNVVVGPGRTCGQRLVEHPDVAKIAFTGSTEVGPLDRRRRGRDDQARDARARRQVGQRRSSPTPTSRPPPRRRRWPCSATPARTAARARGSSCRSRRSTASWSCSRPHVKAMRVGDPLDEATQMGPLISAGQRETVASFLDDGAPVAFRGSAPEGAGLLVRADGARARSSPSDRVAREEVFGPIAAVIPFRDEAEAVRLANDTIYGLSGSIWTRDGARALRVARAIETGVLSINSNSSVRVTTPFGGFKQSGYGRELGPHALDAYTEVKTIFYATEG